MEFDENLVPPNAPNTEQAEAEQEDDESEEDSGIGSEEEEKKQIIGRKMKKIWKFKMNPIKRYITKMETW